MLGRCLSILQGLRRPDISPDERAVRRSGLFDPAWYLQSYVDVARSGASPLGHYLRHGAREGRSPGPRFDGAWYLDQHPEIAETGENPILHHLRTGVPEGRRTTSPFHEEASTAQEVLASGLFDEAWYVTTYPGVRGSPLGPILHFLREGGGEGLSPGPDFDSAWYLAQDPALKQGRSNPLVHYLAHGRREGRRPKPPAGAIEAARLGLASFGDLEPDLFTQPGGVDIRSLWISDGRAKSPCYPAFRDLMRTLQRRYVNLVLVPWMVRGGADLVAAHLCRALVDRDGPGKTLVLLTDNDRTEARDWFPEGIDVRRVDDHEPSLPHHDRADLVSGLVRALVPDRVFNVNSRAGWDAFVRRGAPLSTFTRLYGFAFCRDYGPDGTPGGYADTHLRESLAVLDRVFLDNATFRDELIGRFALSPCIAAKMAVLYQPVAPSQPRAAAADGPFTVLWAARLARQKNIALLLAIVDAAPDLPFEIWGGGEEEAELRGALAERPNATFRGAYDVFAALPLERYGAFLYTALWDGLPNVALEAAAARLPIVSRDVGGLPELVGPDTGWLMPAGSDPAAYAAALRRIRDEPAEAARRVRAASDLVATRHAWPTYLATLGREGGWFPSSTASSAALGAETAT